MSFALNTDNQADFAFVDDHHDDETPGTNRLRIVKYGITANTITYGNLNKLMSVVDYFSAFPYRGASKNLAFLPTWGIAVDARSKRSYYGFVPFGHDAFNVTPSNSDAEHKLFMDKAAHRKKLPGVYSTYLRLDKDRFLGALLDGQESADGVADCEDRYLVLRGLFLTSFLLYVMLLDQAEGVRHVVLTSASSKTSIALAHIVRESALEVRVIGLTSRANVAFVRSALASVYDAVHAYSEVERMEVAAQGRYALVDVAGNHAVIDAVHARFARRLALSSLVGFTHQQFAGRAQLRKVEGVKPQYFFAPTYYGKAQQRFGAGLEAQLLRFWKPFVRFSREFMTIRRVPATRANIAWVYDKMRRGDVSPSEGFVVYNDRGQSKL